MELSEKELLSGFISQRMELGETEWYFRPENISDITGQTISPGERTVIKEKTIDTPEPSDVQGGILNDNTFDAGGSNPLDELYGNVHNCQKCPLGQKRTNFVFGDGSHKADIMFVGEAPGMEEDLQGKPFVGRAGKLLTDMIKAIKLERKDVYIANILKCRPPENRDPKPDEIAVCEPILIRQIEIIKPKIICALGRISGKTLLKTEAPLSALRGKVHDYHGVKLIITYHPAALLRNPNWKPEAWKDLKHLRLEYDGMEL